MKQIINGKLYDTDTAECIADNEFHGGRGTTLYKTKKGAFFAHHETYWQEEHDYIEPLSIPQATELFEQLGGNPDNWPAEFGEPEEA